MPKVSVKLGITMPGPQEYSSFRADFAISDIDVDGDVEGQLADALRIGDRASIEAEAGLAQQAANLSGLNLEGVGVGAQFSEFKEKFGKAWSRLKETVEANAAAIDGLMGDKKGARETVEPALKKRTSGKRKVSK